MYYPAGNNKVISTTSVIANLTGINNTSMNKITISININHHMKKNTIKHSRVSINSKINAHQNHKEITVLLMLLIIVMEVTRLVAKLYLFNKLKTNQTS